MHTYLILQNPGHNRVYYEQSRKLALAELIIASKRFASKCQDIEFVSIANINYLSFKVDNPINSNELLILSHLSFIFALFELMDIDEQKCLVPLAKVDYEYVDPKISNLLKYSGKTNELFTKLMVNIGLLSSDFEYGDRIRLLDPMAGKGTTLFEASVCGFDAAGIEINKKSAHEASVFFKKYLETEKYKHSFAKRKVSGKHLPDTFEVQEFVYASTRDEYKQESSKRRLEIARGDAAYANQFFKKNSFHLLVGDLPYGITHGNRSKKHPASPSRNPLQLLTECLPEWNKVLKKNGILVLSWNTFVMSKQDLGQKLIDNGFSVFADNPYNDFEHRVDMSIKRDIIVAKKIG